MSHRHRPPLIAGGFLILMLVVTAILILARTQTRSVLAAALNQEATSTPQPLTPAPESSGQPVELSQPAVSDLSIGDDTCLQCHGQPGPTLQLQDGETLDLSVNGDEFHASIHGRLGYACVQCHTTVGNYPHPPFSAGNRRRVTILLNQTCKRCHSGQYDKQQDSVHANALTQGVTQAAICTDCHTAHATRQLTNLQTRKLLPEAKLWIPQTCAQCHSAIYTKYKSSVHGAALVDGNPDVPTCIDCHGVHNIGDPTTAAFRLKSPLMCSKCHANEQLMAKYGISAKVTSTYVSDFHGTTVVLFQKESPDAETNKAVCYDCHGIHDIQKTNDPQAGLQMRNNLLKRCQECHPDATENFPSAWMSHYIPSPEKNPVVYYVNLFYKFFIPLTLGGMALLVAMDFARTTYNRYRKPKAGSLSSPVQNNPEQEDEEQKYG